MALSRHRNSVRLSSLLSGASCAVLVFCSLTGVALAQANNSQPAAPQASQPLSQKPQQAATEKQFEAGTSTIAPSVSISWKALSDAANAAEDRFAGPYSGTTKVGCRAKVESASKSDNNAEPNIPMPKGCLDLDWHVNAARNGNVTAKRDGERVEFDIPVKFTGNGGFRGGLAKALSMNNKTFDGTFLVKVSGALKPGKDYCPKLDHPYAHFDWGQPPQVDFVPKTCLGSACIGPWKLPVGEMMTGAINRSLQNQIDAVNNKIPCDQIRDALTKVWKPWSIPVTFPGSPTFYANVEPKTLSVPGVTATDEGIDIAARLVAQTSISSQQLPQPANAQLPENTGEAAGPGQFSLNVPLAVPYATLADFPSGKFVNVSIHEKKEAITPTGVEMFPSNGKLAIAVTFRADAPAKLKGQTGIVWYTATPAIGNDGHLIKLNDLAMTPKAKGTLWALAPAIGRLPQVIASTYSYDFEPQLRVAKDSLHGILADPKNTGGVAVTLSNDALKVGAIALLPNAFVVEGNFNADVSVALGEPKRQANAAP